MNIKKIAKEALFQTLSVLNKVAPKKKRVFIYAADCLYDNNEAVFDYLNQYSNVPVVCTADVHREFALRDNVVIKKDSILRDAYYLLTSKVVVDCLYHALKIKPAHGQTSIQMWHGYPCKGVPNHYFYSFVKYYTVYTYPSFELKPIYEDIFGCGSVTMFLNGNPRNDYLFQHIKSLLNR